MQEDGRDSGGAGEVVEEADRLLEEMKETINNGDLEAAHSIQDDILISCLKILSKNSKITNQVSEIIDIFDNTKKWYA